MSPQPDEHDESTVATSKIVTTILEAILAAVHEGRLQPGQRISDAKLAAQFGTSRTPVREALQRLREIGIIEASPNRFTRIAEVSPRQTADAQIVFLALYEALVDEVVGTAPSAVAERMRQDHAAFDAYVASAGMQQVATTNFTFFSRLVPLSENPILRKEIMSIMHLIRLGSLHLPDYLDFATLGAAQQQLADAVAAQDTGAAHAAIATVRRVEVPLDKAL
jgi:DNA-binding GntR family transcriptional regulator